MPNLTIEKKTDNRLTLNTRHKYVENDIQFNIAVKEAEASLVTTEQTEIESAPAIGAAVNISESIGNKSATEPVEGYYVQVNTSVADRVAIKEQGWLDGNTIQNAERNTTSYFPVDSAEFSNTESINVVPYVSIGQENVTFSHTDNGVKILASGGGTGSANVAVSASQAGYTKGGTIKEVSLSDRQINNIQQFISGVSLESPSNGNNTFSIEIPNNNLTVTFTFSVDSNGNAIIE